MPNFFDSSLFIGDSDFSDTDLVLSENVLFPFPGRCAVEMEEPLPQASGILLPVNCSHDLAPDRGIVVAVNGLELELGDVVIVNPEEGNWIHDFEVSDYKAKYVRLYGFHGKSAYKGIMMKETKNIRDCNTLEEYVLSLVPMEGYVLIKKNPLVDKQGSIHLPDNIRWRDSLAKVLRVSKWKGHQVKEGDIVFYNLEMVRNLVDINRRFTGADYGVIDEKYIWGVVCEE